MSLHVSINGEQRELENGLSLSELLSRLDVSSDGRGLAIALNAEVIPRGKWDETALGDGDQIEVLTATQGG